MFRDMGSLVVATVCVAILSSCGGSAAGPATTEIAAEGEPETRSPSGEQICGLALPCSSPVVGDPHDLYGAMVVAFSEHGALLVADGRAADCVACTDPDAFFDTLLADPAGHQGALAHVYLSLKEAAHEAFAGEQVEPTDSLWAELDDWTASMLQRSRELGEPPPCLLLTAHCTSRPEFIESFVAFLGEVLFREPLNADPGFQKEHAIKLALAANPPGGLEVVIRFVKTKAEVRARAKAVRDLCAYAPHDAEVAEALRWVVRNDEDLVDRARACLANVKGP